MKDKTIQPKRAPRAIVSVPFSRAHFEAIEKAAEKQGIPISAFIRIAALRRAYPLPFTYPQTQTAGTAGITLDNLTVWYAA